MAETTNPLEVQLHCLSYAYRELPPRTDTAYVVLGRTLRSLLPYSGYHGQQVRMAVKSHNSGWAWGVEVEELTMLEYYQKPYVKEQFKQIVESILRGLKNNEQELM